MIQDTELPFTTMYLVPSPSSSLLGLKGHYSKPHIVYSHIVYSNNAAEPWACLVQLQECGVRPLTLSPQLLHTLGLARAASHPLTQPGWLELIHPLGLTRAASHRLTQPGLLELIHPLSLARAASHGLAGLGLQQTEPSPPDQTEPSSADQQRTPTSYLWEKKIICH